MKLTVNELSSIDFGSSHRWSVTLTDIGITGGFSGPYIPATNVEETMFGLGTRDFKLGPATYQLPTTINTPSVSITLADDVKYTIHQQIKEWMEEVFANGRLHLSKVKTLNVIKYDHKDSVVFTNTYEVLPFNDIKFLGDPDVNLLSNTLSLLVTNKIK